jgi:chemotaxis signal transduction protein
MVDFPVNLDSFNGLVVFYLKDKLFCADIDDVFAIVNPADFPQNIKDSFIIKSNLDVENLLIPIIDLHALFGLKNGKITPTSRFICMERNKQAFAFIVDQVEELITLKTKISEEFEFIETKNEKYISGKVKYRGTLFYLPNFEQLINELLIHH